MIQILLAFIGGAFFVLSLRWEESWCLWIAVALSFLALVVIPTVVKYILGRERRDPFDE